MDEDLLHDLSKYKSYRDKSVSASARSLIQLFREKNPQLLERKDRGKPTEFQRDLIPLDYGQSKPKSYLEGAEIFVKDIDDQDKQSNDDNDDEDDQEQDEESEEEWINVSHSDSDDQEQEDDDQTNDNDISDENHNNDDEKQENLNKVIINLIESFIKNTFEIKMNFLF